MIKGSAWRVNGTAFMVKRNANPSAIAHAVVVDAYAIFVQSGRANASAAAIKIWCGNKRWRADPVDGHASGLLAAVLCGRAKNAQAAAI